MKETDLWKKIKKCLPKGTHSQRFENALAGGVPDVNCCHQGNDFWIELKIITGEKSWRFQKPFTAYQTNWLLDRFKVGGRVFAIAMHDKHPSKYLVWEGREFYAIYKKSEGLKDFNEKLLKSPCFILEAGTLGNVLTRSV